MSLLSVRGIGKSFQGVHAVKDVSLEVGRGELAALIGPNGAGKSTTFNMINGQLRPDTGSVMLDDEEISGLPPRAIWKRGVARTFQIAQTFQSMTVAENVQMALVSHRGRTRALWSPARNLFRGEALELLDRVGTVSQADRPCGVLAYGDIKRVELAIAIASEPKLLLMDEPTAGMAPSERRSLMALTSEIVRERGIGVLFTEHDMDVVFGHADRIVVLQYGEIIAVGSPEEVRADPRVREVYLGQSGAAAAENARAVSRSGA